MDILIRRLLDVFLRHLCTCLQLVADKLSCRYVIYALSRKDSLKKIQRCLKDVLCPLGIDSNDLSLKGYIVLTILFMFKKEVFTRTNSLQFIFYEQKLDQFIVSEITIKNKKKGHVISLHRSQSQNSVDPFIDFRNYCKTILNLRVSLFCLQTTSTAEILINILQTL